MREGMDKECVESRLWNHEARNAALHSGEWKGTGMNVENGVRVLAGTLVLTSIALAHWVSQWWLLLGVFVGVNLIQSAFTKFCPAEMILLRLGFKPGCASKP